MNQMGYMNCGYKLKVSNLLSFIKKVHSKRETPMKISLALIDILKDLKI
jgi:hypothetical protein